MSKADEYDDLIFATTIDSDIHPFEGGLRMVMMKVKRNPWIETVDHRIVNTEAICSLWKPSKEEVEGFFDGIE